MEDAPDDLQPFLVADKKTVAVRPLTIHLLPDWIIKQHKAKQSM